LRTGYNFRLQKITPTVTYIPTQLICKKHVYDFRYRCNQTRIRRRGPCPLPMPNPLPLSRYTRSPNLQARSRMNASIRPLADHLDRRRNNCDSPATLAILSPSRRQHSSPRLLSTPAPGAFLAPFACTPPRNAADPPLPRFAVDPPLPLRRWRDVSTYPPAESPVAVASVAGSGGGGKKQRPWQPQLS
ncbi:unnamed protein product, partial [Sphacelaria rigidula]